MRLCTPCLGRGLDLFIQCPKVCTPTTAIAPPYLTNNKTRRKSRQRLYTYTFCPPNEPMSSSRVLRIHGGPGRRRRGPEPLQTTRVTPKTQCRSAMPEANYFGASRCTVCRFAARGSSTVLANCDWEQLASTIGEYLRCATCPRMPV